MLKLKFELCDRWHKTPDEIDLVSIKDLRYVLALDQLKAEK